METNEWGYTPGAWAALTPQKRWKVKNAEAWREQKRRKKQRDRAKERSAREAARVAAEELRKANMPAVRKANRDAFIEDERGLYRHIRSAIPSWYPADVRDDIAHDVAVALLDGEISIAEIGTSIRRFVRQHYDGRNWHEDVSIDGLFDPDGLIAGNTIAAE